MSQKWAYEMSNEELLDEFMDACAKAGISNSGLVIDVGAGHDRAEAHYLKEVVLSRIEGEKPPFRRGDSVMLTTPSVQSVNQVEHRSRFLKQGEIHEIAQVYYQGKHTWALSFMDDAQYRYFAASFAKADKKANAQKKPVIEAHADYDYGSVDASAE